MEKIYELIIIGAGPAGITAGIYAARKKMDCLVLTVDIGGQTAWSGDVENYTGYQFITGAELASKFEEHIKKYGIEVRENEPVLSLKKEGEIIRVKSSKSEYKAEAVIIASGKKSRELGAQGEKEFKNKGLTYCATCDGPLFSGRDVAVIGGGNSALDAALQLTRIAKKVYIVTKDLSLTADPVMCENAEKTENITILKGCVTKEIFGPRFVEGIKLVCGKTEKVINVQGVFVEIGLVPNSDLANDIDKNNVGEIVINYQTETSLSGVFAAGDVTDVAEKQIIIAAGEGAKAALRAFNYLSRKKMPPKNEKTS
ncbi:MAG: FAD-dependent oxidoreductase [Candidatus Omnitrophica bacterium]|nr:FAD-dependent oxidoreductase [Candidatus Omnitrophota bacterium]